MDAMMTNDILNNLRYRRITLGKTCTKVGIQAGHCGSWLSQVENGSIQKVKEKDLEKICQALDTNLEEMSKHRDLITRITKKEAAFGVRNLEKIRKRHKKTVEEFNRQLGLCDGRLRQVLRGYNQFGVLTWLKIADKLDMSLATLIGRDSK